MEVDNTLIGHVMWENVRCGTHSITVEASNDVGSDATSWSLTVSNSYEVFSDVQILFTSKCYALILFSHKTNQSKELGHLLISAIHCVAHYAPF